MSTTNSPDDDPGRTPDGGVPPTGGPLSGGGTPPGADDVRPATPPPPPPVGVPQGSGGWSGASGAGWSGSGGTGPDGAGYPPGPSSSRRSMLLGVAAGAGGVIVLGALAFALWPDRATDEGAATPPAATSEAPSPSTATPTGQTVTTVDRVLPTTQVWTPMGVSCVTGDTLSIAMSGSASHDQTLSGTVGPTGLLDPAFHQYNVDGFPDANTFTVIGSLDQDPGTFFVVGTGATYTCPHDGQLNLGINDRGVQNNSGSFLATITLTHG